MNATRRVRQSVVLGMVVGFVVVATERADAQIFRRPARAAQTDPSAPPPPRGLFPGRASRGQNPDGQFSGGQFSGGQFPGGAGTRGSSPNSAIPGIAIPSAPAAPQEEIFVVVPLDEKPFQVEPTDYVRLTAGGPPGCEFTTKIDGPARVHRKVFVAGSTEGKYVPGTDEAEYEFAMTGVGKVKIDVITTFAGGPAPTVMTYQFEVVPPKP